MMLGRIPSKPDPRDRQLATYVTSARQPSPLMRNWTVGRSGEPLRFSMFSNHRMGNCTCAALGHVDQAAAAHTGRPPMITEADVVAGYSAIGGYPQSDDGASCRDALKFFQRRGEVELYVRLDEASRAQIELAVNLCGSVYVGCDLPASAQRQATWDVAPVNAWDDSYRRRSWGGHAMALLGYDRTGVWFATWGRVQRATWSFVLTYCDEFWMVISDLWTDTGKLTPSGFDLERLREDVARLRT